MTPQATDQSMIADCRKGSARRLRLAQVIPLAGICALLLTMRLHSQLPDEMDASQPTPFAAKVLDLNQKAQPVNIPLNSSVLLETTAPAERVQAIDATVVFAQSVAPRQILLTGVGTGVTQVICWSEDGEQQIFQVMVEMDLAVLNATLRKIDPLSNAEAVPMMSNVVLTGTASSTQAAERMMELASMYLPTGTGATTGAQVQNHLTIAGEQQVLLRCTVAEISRSAARRLGINGFMAGENLRDGFVINQLGGLNPINIGAAADQNVRQNLFFLTGEEGIPLQPTVPLSLGFPRVQMQVFIQALVDNSLLRILAEPNLVAISGQTASFLAGGEFPIPVPQGVDQITIEFREFGARLNFTPVVLPGERIRLHIAPELSELDFSSAVQIGGFSVPGLTQRRMESTVEVGNGQTLAIAGLLSDEVRGLTSKMPGIGDMPVLGALFRSVEYRRNITELVVLVTPEVVAPMNPNQVPPVPGEDLKDPNDWQLYALGLLEDTSNPAQSTNVDAADDDIALVPASPQTLGLHGPWGHAPEGDAQ